MLAFLFNTTHKKQHMLRQHGIIITFVLTYAVLKVIPGVPTYALRQTENNTSILRLWKRVEIIWLTSGFQQLRCLIQNSIKRQTLVPSVFTGCNICSKYLLHGCCLVTDNAVLPHRWSTGHFIAADALIHVSIYHFILIPMCSNTIHQFLDTVIYGSGLAY